MGWDAFHIPLPVKLPFKQVFCGEDPQKDKEEKMTVDELIEELKHARPGTEVKIEFDGDHTNAVGTYFQKHTGILMITNSFVVYDED